MIVIKKTRFRNMSDTRRTVRNLVRPMRYAKTKLEITAVTLIKMLIKRSRFRVSIDPPDSLRFRFPRGATSVGH